MTYTHLTEGDRSPPISNWEEGYLSASLLPASAAPEALSAARCSAIGDSVGIGRTRPSFSPRSATGAHEAGVGLRRRRGPSVEV